MDKEELKEIQDFIKENSEEVKEAVIKKLIEYIEYVQKFQFAHRKIVEEYVEAGLIPAYTAGYISLDKQFCTLGINGLNEAAEFLGETVGNNDGYKNLVSSILSIFKEKNKEGRKKYHIKYNTELIPAESLGVKNAGWDKKDNLYTGDRECYN